MARSILEVWDYRLSHAEPMNYRGERPVQNEAGEWVREPCDTWVACVYEQGERNEPLEIHDTGVKVVDGDLHDGKGLDACFKFYRSVRDKYSRDGIEELKPVVAKLRAEDKVRQQATDAYQQELSKGMAAISTGGGQ